MTAYFVINIELLHPLAAGGYCGWNYYMYLFYLFFGGVMNIHTCIPWNPRDHWYFDTILAEVRAARWSSPAGGCHYQGPGDATRAGGQGGLGRPRKNIWWCNDSSFHQQTLCFNRLYKPKINQNNANILIYSNKIGLTILTQVKMWYCGLTHK